MITNWFKTKTVEKETIVLQKEEEKVITSKDIQEDLHKSFEDVIREFGLKESKETTIENLENQLESFKKENEGVYNKIETLKNLGLTSTPSVAKSLQELKNKEIEVRNKVFKISEELREAEKLKNLISAYSLKYPCYKFIDDKTMFKIMEKYDLVLGDAFIYGREIPNENLEIINYFTTEIKDSEETIQLVAASYNGHFNNYSFIEKPKPAQKTHKEGMDGLWLHEAHYMPMRGHKTVKKEFTVSKFKIVAPESHFVLPTYDIQDYRDVHQNVPLLSIGKDRKYNFSVDVLNKIEAKKREVLDPIACLEVKGGYIILTAWDKEAEIPEIKNNSLN